MQHHHRSPTDHVVAAAPAAESASEPCNRPSPDQCFVNDRSNTKLNGASQWVINGSVSLYLSLPLAEYNAGSSSLLIANGELFCVFIYRIPIEGFVLNIEQIPDLFCFKILSFQYDFSSSCVSNGSCTNAFCPQCVPATCHSFLALA